MSTVLELGLVWASIDTNIHDSGLLSSIAKAGDNCIKKNFFHPAWSFVLLKTSRFCSLGRIVRSQASTVVDCYMHKRRGDHLNFFESIIPVPIVCCFPPHGC